MRNSHIHLRIDNTTAVAHIIKMEGMHVLWAPAPTGNRSVELVPRPTHNDFSRASSRITESLGGHGIQNSGSISGVGTRSDRISSSDGEERSLYSGSIRIPAIGETCDIYRFSHVMKGAFHVRPQLRYSGRWDVSKVLQHLKSKGNITALLLKDLAFRLVMLLVLANADRASDLWVLEVKLFSTKSEDARLASLAKTARPARPSLHATVPYRTCMSLRLLYTLQQYLTRTVNWRESAGNISSP